MEPTREQGAPPSAGFTPALTTTDWNAEWMALQKARRAADDASHWDERSKTYHKAAFPPSPYVRQFVEYAGVRPGDSVFDMGCGTGAVSLPLAAEGHEVLACDFSEGMLGVLRQEVASRGIAVETKLLGWADDWEACGIAPRSFDVACASRSIATASLEDSLRKLTSVARRRAAVTLPVGSSPRTDEAIMAAIGLQRQLGRDFVYAFMILVGMGLLPEVRYIRSARHDTFATEREAYESLERMVRDAGRSMVPDSDVERALENLRTWLPAHLVANPDAGKQNPFGETEKALRLDEPRKVTWAHIAWDVK